MIRKNRRKEEKGRMGGREGGRKEPITIASNIQEKSSRV